MKTKCDSAQETDAEHTHASVEKASEVIGYEPSRAIVAGVKEFIICYREDRDWHEPLVDSS